MTNAYKSFSIVSEMNELLIALKEKQHKLHYSQREMARFLEMSDTQLNLIMRGERCIGMDLVSAVTVKFPELHPLVLKALAEIHSERNGVRV